MSTVVASSKRSIESIAAAPAKKARTSKAADIEKIKLLIAEITDADLKIGMQAVIGQPAGAKKVAATTKRLDSVEVQIAAEKVVRKIQAQINQKLKWQNSFRSLKGGASTRGARVEAICNSPEVFEEISGNRMGATIKTSKDGKMSCSIKYDDDIKTMQFNGPTYRYNMAHLAAPFTASLKDNTITFGFKFTIW